MVARKFGNFGIAILVYLLQNVGVVGLAAFVLMKKRYASCRQFNFVDSRLIQGQSWDVKSFFKDVPPTPCWYPLWSLWFKRNHLYIMKFMSLLRDLRDNGKNTHPFLWLSFWTVPRSQNNKLWTEKFLSSYCSLNFFLTKLCTFHRSPTFCRSLHRTVVWNP